MNLVKIIEADAEEVYINPEKIAYIRKGKIFTGFENKKYILLLFYMEGAVVSIQANNEALKKINSLLGTEFNLLTEDEI